MPWSMLAELTAAGIVIAAATRVLFAVIYANGWDLPPTDESDRWEQYESALERTVWRSKETP